MHHATGVAVALRADEVIRVEDDFAKATVPVPLGQVQQRQFGLRREGQARQLIELDAGQGGEVFVMQE
jgi:hypothetical protein